ncbi:SCP2 sterol-binding domain-containing protein [Pseudohalocynthiibacter aestuariivivens]|jgi:putative sterol carrier protein|uniref:SCP2 sterol-binding domain-containing protein n=1 Tax=Pseudohalocynthiibacter aestuariivivens TaxID=1591409 RepID=A0ABV5JF64_9RHOB|nr:MULTISPECIES: SCP2 sterol-binding domain-containing protein [Pseudohalocynthiibacter]MBS9717865.1 SCP2 sterol-binding domain-containing protein [Pseudohalocynthiibacter aestuariivivens]MCK0102986.1 SCP2 sterol-binding domain-containing protein [Pseudohalocynthiibacter sp. F2068]
MSDVVEAAVATLNGKGIAGFSGTAKFVIEGEGALMIDSDGARAGDEEAEVTLSSDADTFKGILDGDVNPTTAFMTGKLSVDGDMGLAMQLGAVLS